MSLSIRARTAIALALAIISVTSAAQTSGVVPGFVSADDNLSIQLIRAPATTEPESAAASVEINLHTGEMKLQLKHATPSSNFTSLFVSSTSNMQLGTFTTGSEGEGTLQTTLGSGLYIGIFQVVRNNVPQFLSASTSFSIGLTATASASATTQTNDQTSTRTSSSETTQTASITTSTPRIDFEVEPALRSIDAGGIAKFDIRIRQNGTANVLLAARGVPAGGVAIFTPGIGVASPEFHSTLTIVTSTDTTPGTHGITILAIINGQQFNSQVGLEVKAPSTTSRTSSTITSTVSVSGRLSLSLSTEQEHYEPNATVNLHGHVTDDTGSAVSDASVSVQVDGPSGAEIIFVSSLKTDTAGDFQVSFKLAANATAGTYTAFASANKAGYSNSTLHTTFVVGSSSTPSVVIKEVYVTDAAGNISAVFSAGQTVVVWVVVKNSGAPLEGVIWVQVRDPNGIPVSIQLHISTLSTGGTVKEGFGFTLLANPVHGLYTANALVSDKLISQGGTFFASVDTQFALTG